MPTAQTPFRNEYDRDHRNTQRHYLREKDEPWWVRLLFPLLVGIFMSIGANMEDLWAMEEEPHGKWGLLMAFAGFAVGKITVARKAWDNIAYGTLSALICAYMIFKVLSASGH